MLGEKSSIKTASKEKLHTMLINSWKWNCISYLPDFNFMAYLRTFWEQVKVWWSFCSLMLFFSFKDFYVTVFSSTFNSIWKNSLNHFCLCFSNPSPLSWVFLFNTWKGNMFWCGHPQLLHWVSKSIFVIWKVPIIIWFFLNILPPGIWHIHMPCR